MGRHSEPGTGAPTPDRGFWVRLGVGGVVVLLAGTYLLTRGGGDDVSTASPTSSASGSSGSPSAAASGRPSGPTSSPEPTSSTGPSASAAPSGSSTPSASRPPTLALRTLRASYITVRVPGGRTLVSRLFREGQQRRFDQKVLEVVNGRPSAVRFTVNGKPRKPGPADQPETFVVRRK